MSIDTLAHIKEIYFSAGRDLEVVMMLGFCED